MNLLRMVVRWIARLVSLLVVVEVVFLLAVQHSLIYHPQPYQAAYLRRIAPAMTLPYSTSQGAQECYYVPPRSESAQQQPAHVWVLFSGNGSRALDWMPFIQTYPSGEDAFLLVDYPGYGACAGRPSSKTIEESADAALAALSARLAIPMGELQPRLGALGHSLGAAAALAFADEHSVSRIVLVSPFTSLRDMARLTVGWPLCYLLIDNFDNRERLRHIAQRSSIPPVTILFGRNDEVIPFAMGEELARLDPKAVFEPVDGVGHNDIIFDARARIYGAMLGLSLQR